MQTDQILAMTLIGAVLCLIGVKLALRSWTKFERQVRAFKQELSLLGKIMPISVIMLSVIGAIIGGLMFGEQLELFLSGLTLKERTIIIFPVFGLILFLTWLVNTIALRTGWIREKLVRS